MNAFRRRFTVMASTSEITVVCDSRATADRALAAAEAETRRIEAKYSRYRDDSVIARINAAAGGADGVECDDETAGLLEFAEGMFSHSAGLFDITAGVLARAWDFGKALVPSADSLAPLLALVGWRSVERHGRRVRLPRAGMALDFGGFGKEYAADRAARTLREHGIAHGYVNLGGDIAAVGAQPDGTPWLVGIRDPRDERAIIGTVPIAAGGLATSGDYEKYFDLDGQRYCHVLDPRTGWPVTYWRSVSVRAPLCMVAGALATIAMLKEAAGIAFLHGTGTSWLAVDMHGNIHDAPARVQARKAS